MSTRRTTQERTITDEVIERVCDLCTAVFSSIVPVSGRADVFKYPEGIGLFEICGDEDFVSRRMDFCPACAGVLWDELQDRKKPEPKRFNEDDE